MDRALASNPIVMGVVSQFQMSRFAHSPYKKPKPIAAAKAKSSKPSIRSRPLFAGELFAKFLIVVWGVSHASPAISSKPQT